MNIIKIEINTGEEFSVPSKSIVSEILKEKQPDLLKKAVAVKINGQLAGLDTAVNSDSRLDIITVDNKEGMELFRHSASHIMAAAVKILYPDAQLGIGPSISTGFYYDFHLSASLTPEDLSKIEDKMRQIVEQDIPFTHVLVKKEEAIDLFKKRNEPFKLELIRNLDSEVVSLYYTGKLFVDLCRGPHVPSTGVVKHFKLLSLAGAYWHGDERNPVMQRIYGTAFPELKQLKAHLHQLEEARKRDHRILAKELDLFSFQPEGPGFPFWHPNGTVVYNAIQDYMREVLHKHGYEEIKTPLILNEALWHRSGHWDNYKENMYFTTIDECGYAVKPMNCPGALLIYKNTLHSYRELPIKLSEMGLVHRHEKSGVLHGLFRVRQFTQDDAHVFCTPDQMEDEIIKLIKLVEEVYGTFGFTEMQIEMSTRPEKSIGSDEMWKKAEDALVNALTKVNADYEINEGEGAFYGPKIDFHIKDSMSRLWQCGTIQVDFSMPERFELEYIGSDGNRHRPVMIHRAILGSVERFLGIMVEHYAGALPAWLSPVQCLVLPISEKHHEYARSIYQNLSQRGLRCRMDDRSEKMGYKIREAEKQKIPYVIVVGDKEMEDNTISVRVRKIGDQGVSTLENFISLIQDKIKRRDSN